MHKQKLQTHNKITRCFNKIKTETTKKLIQNNYKLKL